MTPALTHLLAFGSLRDESRAVGSGGKTGPSYLIQWLYIYKSGFTECVIHPENVRVRLPAVRASPPNRAARGRACPLCGYFKNQSCCCLGSAFEVVAASYQPSVTEDSNAAQQDNKLHVLICAPSNSALDEIVYRIIHSG
jgi:hypothetical protein